MGRRARTGLVVLAIEVGRRWSEETKMFLSLLARAKDAQAGWHAWRLRCGAHLPCATACAVSSSMMELPGTRGAAGDAPALHDGGAGFPLTGMVE